MIWANTKQLTLLIIPLALGGLYLMSRHWRQRQLWRFFADKEIISKVVVGGAPRALQAGLVIAGILLCVVTLLRPQWGFEWREVRQEGVDILVAVDVSKSMLTRDILPDRLTRTKFALQELVQQLRGDRIGLIAFSGEAFVQCPLTVDYNGFLLTVEDLDTTVIPRGGTNIAAALNLAVETFQRGSEGTSQVLIVVTDGESHEGDVSAAVKRMTEANIKVYTIGVGTREGELIMISDDKGQSSFLKDASGQVVKSRLNETLLQEIALNSRGTYVKATAAQFGLGYIYKNKIAPLEKTERGQQMEKRYIERFQVPLAGAVLLLLLEMVLAAQAPAGADRVRRFLRRR